MLKVEMHEGYWYVVNDEGEELVGPFHPDDKPLAEYAAAVTEGK